MAKIWNYGRQYENTVFFYIKNKTIQTDGLVDTYYVISFKNCSYNFFLVVSVYRKSQEFRILVCSL